jgi:hypothetical protein
VRRVAGEEAYPWGFAIPNVTIAGQRGSRCARCRSAATIPELIATGIEAIRESKRNRSVQGVRRRKPLPEAGPSAAGQDEGEERARRSGRQGTCVVLFSNRLGCLESAVLTLVMPPCFMVMRGCSGPPAFLNRGARCVPPQPTEAKPLGDTRKQPLRAQTRQCRLRTERVIHHTVFCCRRNAFQSSAFTIR